MKNKKKKFKQTGILFKSDIVDKNCNMYTKEALEKAVKEFDDSKYYGTNYQLICNYCCGVFVNSNECGFCGGKRNENKKED